MLELEDQGSKDNKIDERTSFSLIGIISTLELISITQLEDNTCDQALTNIHVEYDPTTEGTPRLPYYVQQIYNLITDTCIND